MPETLAPVKPKKEFILVLISLAIIAIYMLPAIYLGRDGYVISHDNLDCWVPMHKMLAESGKLFADSSETIPAVMNGIPRGCLSPEFNYIPWMYVIFGPFNAELVMQVFVRLVAFFGMYIFLRRYCLEEDEYTLVRFAASICFALLPFYTYIGISTSSIPLALYAFLTIRQSPRSIAPWLILVLTPFFTGLVLVYFFFLLCISVFFVCDWVRSRRFNLPFFLGIALMSGAFLFCKYRLIGLVFGGTGFVSQRSEFLRGGESVTYALRMAWHALHRGQYHAESVPYPVMIPTVILASVLGCIARGKPVMRKSLRLLWLTLALIVLFVAWYGLGLTVAYTWLSERVILFRMLNIRRFHFMLPFLWGFAFAISLKITRAFSAKAAVVGLLFAAAQIAYLNYRNDTILGYRLKKMSYRQVYSTGLFDKVKEHIARPQSDYRVVCIGFHPAVALYNGFYTLDLYTINYPLEYKYKFRKIIAPELDKNDDMKLYFDRLNSRVYMFVAEQWHMPGYVIRGDLWNPKPGLKIRDLTINTQALRDLGGQYVLSAVEILNAQQNDLALEEVFRHEDSPWTIYLYRVKPPTVFDRLLERQ